MRRMLSGFLATAMVASVCATMSFAESTEESKAASVRFDFSGVTLAAGKETEDLSIKFPLDNGGAIVITLPGQSDYTAATIDKDIVDDFSSKAKISLENKPTYANGRAMHAEDFILGQKGRMLVLQTKIVGTDVDFNCETINAAGDPVGNSTSWGTQPKLIAKFYTAPVNGKGSDSDLSKTENIIQDIRNIIVCDKDGQPLPLTEKDDGVDKDQNGDDGVQSGQTVYFMIRNGLEWKFEDDTYWKLKLSKGENGKYIKSISDVTKKFSDDLFSVYDHVRVPGTGGSRSRYIKVEMNEIHTDDEFKVTLDMRLNAKSKAVDVFDGVDDDDELKVQDFYFYVKNITKAADGDWSVGVGGLMLDPVKNDWNEVTYYDEDGDVAFMKFFGDSNTSKFYAKLSTQWEHADYASYFNDQDAYIFRFTGSPSLSSTSRADLEIYNPFVDDDGNETFDPEQAVIYQIVDGDLFKITDSFEYREGDSGEMAFCTRTRFLGTYIICQKEIEEASTDDVVDLVPDDVVPDNNAGAPVEINPGNNNNGGNGGKAPANTGKF